MSKGGGGGGGGGGGYIFVQPSETIQPFSAFVDGLMNGMREGEPVAYAQSRSFLSCFSLGSFLTFWCLGCRE